MQNQAIISIILLQNVETFVPEFIEILPEFSTNKNFCGCAYTPCTLASYTTAASQTLQSRLLLFRYTNRLILNHF